MNFSWVTKANYLVRLVNLKPIIYAPLATMTVNLSMLVNYGLC